MLLRLAAPVGVPFQSKIPLRSGEIMTGRESTAESPLRGTIKTDDAFFPLSVSGYIFLCRIPLLFPVNPFRLVLGPDLLGKIFVDLVGFYKIPIDLLRDSQVVIDNAGLEFQFQDLRILIVSYRAQDPGLNRQSFQAYQHSLTCAVRG